MRLIGCRAERGSEGEIRTSMAEDRKKAQAPIHVLLSQARSAGMLPAYALPTG